MQCIGVIDSFPFIFTETSLGIAFYLTFHFCVLLVLPMNYWRFTRMIHHCTYCLFLEIQVRLRFGDVGFFFILLLISYNFWTWIVLGFLSKTGIISFYKDFLESLYQLLGGHVSITGKIWVVDIIRSPFIFFFYMKSLNFLYLGWHFFLFCFFFFGPPSVYCQLLGIYVKRRRYLVMGHMKFISASYI